MVVRDIARVRDLLPYAEADKLAKMVPDDLNIALEQALEKSPNLRMNTKIIRLPNRLLKPGKLLKEWYGMWALMQRCYYCG